MVRLDSLENAELRGLLGLRGLVGCLENEALQGKMGKMV
jgi:hypothetical protein